MWDYVMDAYRGPIRWLMNGMARWMLLELLQDIVTSYW